MKTRFSRFLALVMAMLFALLTLAGCAFTATTTTPNTTEAPKTAFTPKLDTQAAVSLNLIGFFGNFEALDQVINHFNDIYPNVTISYEQSGGRDKEAESLNNNKVDIFMTDDTNLRYSNWDGYYVGDRCFDLTNIGIDTTAFADGMLESCTYDGKLLRVPMGLTLHGIVVNKTLLAKEGLKEPTTYQEFLEVCESLKQKGYTPIQGPEASLDTNMYYSLAYNMVLAMIGSDAELLNALNSGDASAAEKLTVPFARLKELMDRGYISSEVNAEYPDNNYDGAILKFFEGNVPFWLCDTEKVSGMRKRESKSEAFQAAPFEYAFTFPPMGDSGAYAFVEPWYGFSVNKDSEHLDWAVEFVRFLATQDQLNTLASVKGVPSVAKVSDDARYTQLATLPSGALTYVNKGAVLSHMKDMLKSQATQLGKGEITAEQAAEAYVASCAEIAREMASEK